MTTNILEREVPYFPYPITRSENGEDYLVSNHHMIRPLRLNAHAALVLRLADGNHSLHDVVESIGMMYSDIQEPGTIRGAVVEVLKRLTDEELIWWRSKPVESVPVGPPQSVFCEITAACNLRCHHCVVAAGKKAAGEMSTQRWMELFEEMAEFGVDGVAFSGGEPLIHKEFRLLVEHAYSLGLLLQVATNGTMVTPEIAHWLKELDAEVQVSLDGSTAEIHDHMRPGNNAYTNTLKGIKALVAAGHDLSIGMVLSQWNIHDVPAMLDLVESLGVTHFRTIPFVPKGRGEAFHEMEVMPAQMKQVTEYLHQQRGLRRVDITRMEFEDSLECNQQAYSSRSESAFGCSGAVSYATVTPTGELLPCHFFSGVRADSVANKPFNDVWMRSRFLNYFRSLDVEDLHGKCSGCSMLSGCGGSCRAVNFAKGDIFGTNHACWVND